jgi:hypothetical protein
MMSPKNLSHESGLPVKSRLTLALYLRQDLYINLASQLVLRIQVCRSLDKSLRAMVSQVRTKRRPVGIQSMAIMGPLRVARLVRPTMTGWRDSTPGRNKEVHQHKFSSRLHLNHRRMAVKSRHWLLKAPTDTTHPRNPNMVGR